MTITEFLLARIAEDERAATRIVDCGDTHPMASIPLPPGVSVACGVAHYRVDKRVQAECEAKRRIVEWWDGWDGSVYDGWTEAASIVLGMMSTVYADHPDYREEWRA